MPSWNATWWCISTLVFFKISIESVNQTISYSELYQFVAKAFYERGILKHTCFTNLYTGNQLQKQNHPEIFHGGLIYDSKIKTFEMIV